MKDKIYLLTGEQELHLGFTALCEAVKTLFLLKQRQRAVFTSLVS